MRKTISSLLIAGALCIGFTGAHAQSGFRFEAMAQPAQNDAIPLDTGPQARDVPPEHWFRMDGGANVRNVSHATLTPYLPANEEATGTAVIVAPGGGFLGLAMEVEGTRVAQWLAAQGVAAFVLKYRLVPTPADFKAFANGMAATRSGKPSSVRPPAETPEFAIQDGLAALALVRTHAKDWGVDPARVGMMGFSAGAFTTISASLAAKPGEKPAFIAPIYGRLTARDVPSDAPPMFAVLASDDHFFASQGFALIDGWIKAKRPVEFHLYQDGGHGFGLGRPGTTSDGWINQFMIWLRANHLAPTK
ncbi:alpha/beta hydrolase [Sphingobium sp.]|uniref:alpha/beta hydrolase n=1 Tax=Sphingobium sp. TaxID=1912891 RepID=UPI002603BDAA|nr:alpha/beta hydrolase [Sphingobium sp.]